MSMSMAEIKKHLESLRLHGMLVTLEARSMQANQGEQSFLDIVACLIQDELDLRHSRLTERRLRHPAWMRGR